MLDALDFPAFAGMFRATFEMSERQNE